MNGSESPRDGDLPVGEPALPRPLVDGDRLVVAALRGDHQMLARLRAPFPELQEEPSSTLLRSKDRHERLLPIQFLAGKLRDRGDYITSSALARALFRALEFDPAIKDPTRQHVRLMAANVLDVLTSVLIEIGNAAEVCRDGQRWLQFIERVGFENERSQQIRLKQLEALLQAGHYDDAMETATALKKERLPPALAFEFNRLSRHYRDVMRGEAEEEQPAADQDEVAHRIRELLASLELPPDLAAVATGRQDPGAAAATPPQSTGTLLGWRAEPRSLAEFAQQVGELAQARQPYAAFAALARGAATLMSGPRAIQERGDLLQLHALIKSALPQARRLGFWDDGAHLAWLGCIALKRAGELSAAAGELRAFRDDIDLRRLRIPDPRHRAGMHARFRYLYEVSAEVLAGLGESYDLELFHVIDGSKSKILGELTGARPLTSRDATSTAGLLRAMEAETIADLRTMLAASPARAAYLTLFCDKEVSYGVLVRPDGTLRSHRAAVGTDALLAAADRLHRLNDGDPDDLRGCAPIDPDAPQTRPYDEVLTTYEPLLSWLAPELQELDVLCVSPDPGLVDVPLQMVPVDGRPLIDRVGVSVAPSATMLAHMMRAAALMPRPERAIVFAVPQQGTSEAAQRERRMHAELVQTLAGLTDTQAVAAEVADAEELRRIATADSVLHFATHGTFEPSAPVEGSGLLLAKDGRLPEATNQSRHLFSAQDLALLDLRGAHVVVSACLCGRSREVSPGESLGVIRAAIQAGASSVTAAHWRADVRSATALFQEYYAAWLERRLPAWEAHRAAIRQLQGREAAYEHPYHWATFVRYGPWQ